VEKYADQKLVAIFGHEPDVSTVVARLLGTSDSERLTFKKGGAALLDVPSAMAEGAALIWYAPHGCCARSRATTRTDRP
jgi:phosphohistidine phosphatase SixA